MPKSVHEGNTHGFLLNCTFLKLECRHSRQFMCLQNIFWAQDFEQFVTGFGFEEQTLLLEIGSKVLFYRLFSWKLPFANLRSLIFNIHVYRSSTVLKTILNVAEIACYIIRYELKVAYNFSFSKSLLNKMVKLLNNATCWT